MASPQTEKGYIKIANELYDELLKWHFSSYEFMVLIFIIRKTYGWNKKSDWISLSQFVEGTRIRQSHVCRAIKLLQMQNIITKGGNRNTPKYGIQKDYDLWKALPKGVRSHHSVKGGNSVVSKGGHTKETITKDILLAKAKHKKMFKHDTRKFSSDYEEKLDYSTGDVLPDKEVLERAKLKADVDRIISEYDKQFESRITKDPEKKPRQSVPMVRKTVMNALRLYSADEIVSYMPYFFENDFYRKSTWAIWTLCSTRVLNQLKNDIS